MKYLDEQTVLESIRRNVKFDGKTPDDDPQFLAIKCFVGKAFATQGIEVPIPEMFQMRPDGTIEPLGRPTLRDQFAMAAMDRLMEAANAQMMRNGSDEPRYPDSYRAYRIADEMLKARESGGER